MANKRDEAYMSRPEAVGILMEMMGVAKDELELEALQLACRNLVKRYSDYQKNKARRKAKAALAKASGEEVANG